MKLLARVALAAIVAALGGVAYFAEEQKSTGGKMTDAAAKFLDALTPEQKAKATYAFHDKERVNWIYVPVQDKDKRPGRKGLRLEEMNEDQKKAVLELLHSGTSASGFQQAVTIMSLENILLELEKNGAMVRNPGWYFVTVFGTPAKTGSWGWRIEGHHLSLNFTVKDGQVASATPAFFGANPAEIKSGDRKGQRILGDVEDAATALVKSLDAEQKKAAVQPKQFGELAQHEPAEKTGPLVGLPAEKMTQSQKDLLVKLLKAYTARMPAAIGRPVEVGQRRGAGKSPLRLLRQFRAGEAAFVPRAGPDVRRAISERARRFGEKPGQSHSQCLARVADGFRATFKVKAPGAVSADTTVGPVTWIE